MSEETLMAIADAPTIARQAERIADLERERAALLQIAYAAWSLSDEITEFGAPVAGETMEALDTLLLARFGGPDQNWLMVRGAIRAAQGLKD